VERCFAHLLESTSELDPPAFSIIPAHMEQPIGILLHTRVESPAVHENREIVSRLFEHSPEISYGDFKLFLHRPTAFAVVQMAHARHSLDSDAHSVDSEDKSNRGLISVGRDSQEDHKWKFKQIRNRVKEKR
jgi:hypothetical protein